ncbi:ribose ABC transporter ATP-binding protein [Bacillus toyonensis]|uniref:ribose ABC transporter ATP-binding protein n=1 Tax=Bacillus toyonensis TaxID=155322 RepID=UPI000B443139|nr:ribose ABC transporter ATP-binding protein [Bacillus toyonensis]MED3201030.1 ribose ABC transporter ATP-binding protein [Bacillus toyonensis]OTX09664.1 ribose ABC transporter ATP-binding protein [Bacillus thuringiensis serovar seoulensis]
MNTIRFLISVYNEQKLVVPALPSTRFLGDKLIEGTELKKINIVKQGPSTGVFKGKLIKSRWNLMNCI